ncbi:carbohydrate ABC transporter permease [Paenibacillus sp. GCM10023252]|uniref:carbohydrate ABC transporter permease n=1 Tax=Paenibacillus sp. GCM10023252 TaxID=3252649 RepID=UPI003609C4F2
MYYKTRGYRAFNVMNYVFLALAAVSCILPMIHILALSFSGSAAVNANIVTFWPIDFTMDAYYKTANNPAFLQSIGIAAQRVVYGVTISMVVTILAAYPLSKGSEVFRGRSVFAWFFIFTMLFGGGLIPFYWLITKLNMMNTMWALILPGAVSVYNMILLMNFFRNVPKELEEAALIDGAGDLRVLWSIFLPVSKPAIATLTLFSIVGQWNSWFDGLLFMTRPENYPLATYLQTIVVQQDLSAIINNVGDLDKLTQRSVKAAQIFIGAFPVLVVYPFLQKHFTKGIVLGAVKE